jgi:RNA-directed DNA polymerase
LQPEQYAYRADRSALDAVQHVHKLINTGHDQIVDADLSSYVGAVLLDEEGPSLSRHGTLEETSTAHLSSDQRRDRA